MIVQYMPVRDVYFTNEFINDWERAPQRIKNKMDKLVDNIRIGGVFPTSMNVREAFKDDLYIGTVTQHNQAWRVLFWINEEDNTIMLHRLLTHDQRDHYLRI